MEKTEGKEIVPAMPAGAAPGALVVRASLPERFARIREVRHEAAREARVNEAAEGAVTIGVGSDVEITRQYAKKLASLAAKDLWDALSPLSTEARAKEADTRKASRAK